MQCERYLDGSVKVRFLPAVEEQACDGDPIGQVVDEGDVVDQVVRFSDAENDDGGGALRKDHQTRIRSSAPITARHSKKTRRNEETLLSNRLPAESELLRCFSLQQTGFWFYWSLHLTTNHRLMDLETNRGETVRTQTSRAGMGVRFL